MSHASRRGHRRGYARGEEKGEGAAGIIETSNWQKVDDMFMVAYA